MSSIIWAKLDPGFYSNRKVIRAGRNGREVFVFALCVNASRGAKGRIPASDLEPWYVAHQLGITEPEAEDGVTKALQAGLLERMGDEVAIVGWDDDWGRRPLTRGEIQKSYRDRQAERYQPTVTRDDQSNALPIREIREIRERDTVTLSLSGSSQADSKQQDASTGSGARGSAASGAARGAQYRVDETWKPTQAAAEYAQAHGLDLAHEAQQFRRVARSKGHTYADVDIGFELFMSRSRDVGKKPKKGATTGARQPRRVRDELGQMLEEGLDGELRPVGAESTTG